MRWNRIYIYIYLRFSSKRNTHGRFPFLNKEYQMARRMPQQLLFILFLIANSFNADAAGVKFELIHRHHLHPGGPLPLRKLVHGDASRAQAISRKVRSRFNASGELPLHSAADYGVGQYLVKLKMGSPGQHLVLIPDTGSDLIWTKCRYTPFFFF